MLKMFISIYFLIWPIYAGDNEDSSRSYRHLYKVIDNPALMKKMLGAIDDPEKKLQLISSQDFITELTSLHHAASCKGSAEVIKILLAEIKDPANVFHLLSLKSNYQETPFQLAVMNHGYEAVKIMLDAVPEFANKLYLIKQQNSDENNALHLAVEKSEVVQLLLGSVPSIGQKFQLLKTKNKFKETPLHCAATEKFYDKDKKVSCALSMKFMLACPFYPKRKFRLLKMQDICVKTPLHSSSEKGDYEEVKCLLNTIPKKNITLLKMKDEEYCTPLHKSIGNLALVEEILSVIEDQKQKIQLISMPNIFGETSLHHAADYRGGTEVIKILLAEIKDPAKVFHLLSLKSKYQETPFQLAVAHHGYEAVKIMFDAVPEFAHKLHLIKQQNREKSSVLHLAAKQSKVIQLLLDSVPSIGQKFQLLKTQNKFKENPLHCAAGEKFCGDKVGYALTIKIMLAPFDHEQKLLLLRMEDQDKKTPIHHFAEKGNYEEVKLLFNTIPENISIFLTMKDKIDNTPLHLAAKNFGNTEIAKLILDSVPQSFEFLIDCNNKGKTPLHITAAKKRSTNEIMKIILNSVKDPEERLCLLKAQCNSGETPFYRYAKKEKYKTIENLLKMINDPDHIFQVIRIQNCDGRTPLHCIIEKNTFPSSIILKKLLDHLNDLTKLFELFTLQDHSGSTILHYATKNWNYEFIKIILEKLPDYRLLQIRDDDGETPLFNSLRKNWDNHSFFIFDEISVKSMLSIISNPLEIYQILQKKNKNQESILHFAAKEDLVKFIKIALESVKDSKYRFLLLKLQDKDGKTPLHLAVEKKLIKPIQELMYAASTPEKRYSLLEIKDCKGVTPLLLAAGKAQILKTLIEGVKNPTTS